MNFKLEVHHFEELIKKSYSLDHIFLLKLIHENNDISPLLEGSMKIKALEQGLIRKGLITDEGALTITGTELLVFLDTKNKTKFLKTKVNNTDFETWWKAYPGTDTFAYKDCSFIGSRTLRQNKEECRIKFDKIILEGEYTANQLTEAMQYDVDQKKAMSAKLRSNKLSFMQNSLTYLNQRSYEPFIELIQQGVKIEEPIINKGTDI